MIWAAVAAAISAVGGITIVIVADVAIGRAIVVDAAVAIGHAFVAGAAVVIGVS